MNLSDLVTQYVDLRRTMGHRFKRTEYILRSFCRAIGLRTSVTRIRPKAVAEFLAGAGTVGKTWHVKYGALKGFFQFAVLICPLHLFTRGTPSSAGFDSVVPSLPEPH